MVVVVVVVVVVIVVVVVAHLFGLFRIKTDKIEHGCICFRGHFGSRRLLVRFVFNCCSCIMPDLYDVYMLKRPRYMTFRVRLYG